MKVGGASSVGAVATTSAMNVGVTTAGSIMNIQNNLCMNERTGGASGTFHLGMDLTVYPRPGVTVNSDFNNMSADDAVRGWDGGYNGVVYNGDIGWALYMDATCTNGIEQHSVFKDANFIGANSCILGMIGGDMNPRPIAGITTDRYGNPRNAVNPYKGCYEGPSFKILNLGARLEGKTADGFISVVIFDAAGCLAKS